MPPRTISSPRFRRATTRLWANAVLSCRAASDSGCPWRARFLRDAPILILDEPTSALDLETEALVMQAIERLKEGRTTFIIAHRMSSLAKADIRLVVEGGRVEQRDAHLDEVVLG